MKVFKGQPITGSRPQVSRGRPLVPDAKDTSLDAQRNIDAAPTPFKDRDTAAQVPAGTNRNFQKAQTAGLPAKGIYGTKTGGYVVSNASILKGTSLSASEMAAVGYSANATKSRNPIISGSPTQNARRVIGGGNQPFAKRRG